jgi:hypothetical protein
MAGSLRHLWRHGMVAAGAAAALALDQQTSTAPLPVD